MATGAAPLKAPPQTTADRGTRFVEYDEFIDSQLDRARREVKGVDLAGALLTLAAGSLAYLLAAALVDHWMFRGGLGFWGRMAALVGFLAASGTYFVTAVLPILIRRVNPVYAAYTIESSRPTLKNTLINFLLLRGGDGGVPEAVYEIVEEQAAKNLSHVTVESTADRSKLIQVLYVLLGLVAIAGLYTLFSPKNPLASVGRVMAPWADIPVPTRVTIRDVEPGDLQSFYGRYFTVRAHVEGIGDSEPVTLLYSTADGQVVDRALAMRRPSGDHRHAAELPEGAGLQQDLTYVIAAGDARTEPFRVRVMTPPAIGIETVEYRYPAYTGLPPREIKRQGQLAALEGTQVTLRARANHEIASAYVDFDCDGRRDLPMTFKGLDASVSFALKLGAGGRAEHESYQLLFTDRDAHENLEPIRYKIEVTPDRAPEIAFEPAPRERDQVVPAGGALAMSLSAIDPDFRLTSVNLLAQKNGEPLLDERLLAEPRGGRFRAGYVFDTNRFELAEGDRVVYWAAAEDDKTPSPNRTETRRYTLLISSRANEQERQEQLADASEQAREANQPRGERQDGQAPKQDRTSDEQAAEGEQDSAQGQNPEGQRQDQAQQARNNDSSANSDERESTQGSDEQSQSASGTERGSSSQSSSSAAESGQGAGSEPQSRERVDPEKDSGEAIDEINKFFEERNGSRGDLPDETDQPPSKEQEQDGGQTEQSSPQNQEGEQAQQDGAAQQQSGQRDAASEQQSQGGQQQPSSQGREQSREQAQSGRESAPIDQPDEASSDADQGANPREPQAEGAPREPSEQDQSPRDSADQSASDESGQGNQAAAAEEKTREGESGASRGDRQESDRSEQPGSEREPTGAGAQQEAGGEQGEQPPSGQQGADAASQEPNASEPHRDATSPSDAGGVAGEQGQETPAADQGAGGAQSEQPNLGETGQNEGAAGTGGQTENPGETEAAQGREAGEGEGEPMATEKRGASGTKTKGAQTGETPAEDTPPQTRDDLEASPHRQRDRGEVEDVAQASQAANPDAQGDGNRSGNTSAEANEESQGDRSRNNEEHRGGSEQRLEKGDAGPGRGTEDRAGSPEYTEELDRAQKPREKPDPSGSNPPRDEGADMPQSLANNREGLPHDRAENSSEGEHGGDRRGGGGKGGNGQRANQEGTGAAGENTASDEGGGQASESGEGAVSDRGGDRSPAARPTDDAESAGRGPGSKTQRGTSQAGGTDDTDSQAGEPTPSSESSQASDRQTEPSTERLPPSGDQQPSREPQNGSPSPSGAASNGGNAPSGARDANATNDATTGAPPPASEPVGDEANAEYTRKAIDLAIDRLKDQLKRGEPDPELLKRLKWTREEMEAFVRRWDEMRRAAGQSGEAGRQGRARLDDAIRNLGLRQRGTSLGSGQFQGDTDQNLRETRRTQPPPEYADQFRAYSTGVARGPRDK